MPALRVLLPLLSLQLLTFAQQYIPAWFENLPSAPAGYTLAVGYSGKFNSNLRARNYALNTAFTIMAKQLNIRLLFELEELNDGRLRLLNPTFKQFYEETILNNVKADYGVIDSSITAEGYFILIAYPRLERLNLPDNRDKNWGPRPSWVSGQLPEEKGFVYGLGQVARYRSWVRAWHDADEHARFDIGKNLNIKAESTTTSQRDNRKTIESTVIKQSYDLLLKNVTVVARWFDPATATYYALARAPRQ